MRSHSYPRSSHLNLSVAWRESRITSRDEEYPGRGSSDSGRTDGLMQHLPLEIVTRQIDDICTDGITIHHEFRKNNDTIRQLKSPALCFQQP